MKKTLIGLGIGLAVSGAISSTAMAHVDDIAAKFQQILNQQAPEYFGFQAIGNSPPIVPVARVPGQTGASLLKIGNNLKAEIVSRKVAQNSDMIAFWPTDSNPTHIVSCVEAGNDQVGTFPSGQPKLTPSVQTVNLKTKEVKTILRGMIGCDGIRRTPWNTIAVTEEVDDGGLYEILNPLTTTDQTLVARGASETTDAVGNPVTGQIEYRPAVGNLAWEGLEFLPNGVLYYGDEERPGTGGADADGGSIFKFVPTTPFTKKSITALSESPLVSGNVYAYQASCVAKTSGAFPQFGQGCEIGQGAWLKADPTALRFSVRIVSASGFYRPEDLHLDPLYKGPGAKFCWANTGNKDAANYGEVVCLIDTNPVGSGEKVVETEGVNGQGLTYLADAAEAKGFAVATANRFLEGDTLLNQPDNLAFQPISGNLAVIEDNPLGDVWSCLPDKGDRDLKSDGCVKMLTVKDSSAEPTGFIFTADGKTAYVHIQHSDDAACIDGTDCAKNDDYLTDDLVKITGFTIQQFVPHR